MVQKLARAKMPKIREAVAKFLLVEFVCDSIKTLLSFLIYHFLDLKSIGGIYYNY